MYNYSLHNRELLFVTCVTSNAISQYYCLSNDNSDDGQITVFLEVRSKMFKALRYEKLLSDLLSVELFRELDSVQITDIARAARENFYDAGQVIFQQGEPCEKLLIVLEGTANVSFSSEDGKEVIICELQKGDIIGEMELLSKRKRLTNCVASSRIRMLVLGRRIFERLLGSPAFSRALLNTICRRLQQSLVFAEGVSLHTLETRLARLLVSMSETYGRRVIDGVMIDRTLSQSFIGQMVNASRPRINVQLQSWKNGKLIRLTDNRITILDEQALRSISQSPLAVGQ